jgi:hypothetical protein
MWNEFNQALSLAAKRVIVGVADLLPGVLAMIAAILLALPLAWLVGFMVRRSLKRLRFDERIARWGFTEVSEWSPSRSATLLVARVVSWTIIVFGLLVGLTALDANLTSGMTMRVFAYLPNVIAAAVILILGTFFARFLARGVLVSAVNMQVQSARLISVGVKWLILVLTGAMAMEHLGIGGEIIKMAFGISFGGIVLAMSLAVGLGSKELVTRSWERREERPGPKEVERPLKHL